MIESVGFSVNKYFVHLVDSNVACVKCMNIVVNASEDKSSNCWWCEKRAWNAVALNNTQKKREMNKYFIACSIRRACLIMLCINQKLLPQTNLWFNWIWFDFFCSIWLDSPKINQIRIPWILFANFNYSISEQLPIKRQLVIHLFNGV